MIVKDSSKRATRRSNGNPKARYSRSFHPAPSPRISRPPEIASTVAACLANIAGAWNPVEATNGPSSTRSVTAARAASDVHTSHGPRAPVGRSYNRWSPSHSESNPTASAARAIAISSGHSTRRSTSGSWMPTPARTRPMVDPRGDASERAPASERPSSACVAGERSDVRASSAYAGRTTSRTIRCRSSYGAKPASIAFVTQPLDLGPRQVEGGGHRGELTRRAHRRSSSGCRC